MFCMSEHLVGWVNILVIDVQSGFLGKGGTGEIVAPIRNALEDNPEALVVATVYRNEPGSPCEVLSGWNGCKKSDDWRIPEELLPHIDRVVTKATYGCPNLGLSGRTLVVGIDTDVCVLAAALGLFDAGVDVYVDAALCRSTGGDASHRAGLLALSRIIGSDRILNYN